MKKKLALLLLALALAGGGYWLYRQERLLRQPSDCIVLFGNVDIRDVLLGFRVGGRIAEIRYEEGDRVEEGDLLAVLDKQPFVDNVNLYAAQIEEAKITRRKVEKPFLRRAALTGIGAVSTEERDDAEATRDEAEAQVNTAEARLQQAETQLRDTDLFAPSNGIILTRAQEPGAIVEAGRTVYSLALDTPVWIRTYIDEPNLGNIHPGQRALVSTDSGGGYEGQIGFISPQAEFTPKNVETARLRTDLVYRLRVIVDNPDKGLRQGMPVTVRVMKDRR